MSGIVAGVVRAARKVSIGRNAAGQRLGMVIGALAFLVASCTSSDPADFSGPIDIGGRHVFVECRGTGSPTVVLISGKGVDADDWLQILDPADPAHQAPGDDVGAGFGLLRHSDDAVLPSVARFTRVCAYDRPNTRADGHDVSTPRAQPHTVDLDVEDLRALLVTLREPEPYVLVPHSYGGLIAALYARMYPQGVAGLVMVDAATELIGDILSPTALANWDTTNRVPPSPMREAVEVVDAFARINAAPPMPKVPAIVLTADKPYRIDLLPPEIAGEESLTFADWLASQQRLASALGAPQIAKTNSGHHIYLYAPALVVDAIRGIVERRP
jgi:pimeloyl-ACP methyl ester carboxylesterase